MGFLGFVGGSGSGSAVVVTTSTAILQSTPSSVTLAFASDISQFFLWDGSEWQINSSYFNIQPDINDLGYLAFSNRQGYGKNYVTDKDLANCTIGYGGGGAVEGTIRFLPNTGNGPLSIFVHNNPDFGSTYLPIPIGIQLRNIRSQNFAIEQMPLSNWLVVFNGNSEALGLNGLPLTQGYQTSMGAYPASQYIDGGTF